MITRSTVIGLLLCTAAVAHAASAACMRVVPDKPGTPPYFDGPGSFGPLNNTVNLDCLTFAGTVEGANGPVAVLKDENGVVYRVKIGDYVGENSGYVAEISPARIKIIQLVRGPDNALAETSRFLFAMPAPATSRGD